MKWAVQRNRTSFRIERTITTREFDNLRAGVQELDQKVYLERQPSNYLKLRSHFPQFDFQSMRPVIPT